MASDDSTEDQTWQPSARRSKRIKTNSTRPARLEDIRPSTPHYQPQSFSLGSLLDVSLAEVDFEDILPKENYLATRTRHLENISEADGYGYHIRPLTAAEIHGLRAWLRGKMAAGTPGWTIGDAILTRRLQLHKLKRGSAFTLREDRPHPQTLKQPTVLPPHVPPSDVTMSTICSMRRTPYECSFASRLKGNRRHPDGNPHLIHRDNETRAPWVELLMDIRHHYSLTHLGCEPLDEVNAPIDYVSLRRSHLQQVHDLLGRIFWPGIDVSDSLQYSPTQCTIVSVYKELVVGAAFLSSPEEPYLTYLVVRPGWENANIASIMLYHLITANPKKDITLHVSANNPAMLLYNKFGFKAEEFVVGFYEDYLSRESRACKNAFRLRLRR